MKDIGTAQRVEIRCFSLKKRPRALASQVRKPIVSFEEAPNNAGPAKVGNLLLSFLLNKDKTKSGQEMRHRNVWKFMCLMKTNGYEHWRRNLCKKRQGTPAPQRLYFLTRANKTNSTAKFGKSYSFSKETAKSTGTEYLENSRFLESKRLGTPAPQGLEIYAPQKKRAGILARQGLETYVIC